MLPRVAIRSLLLTCISAWLMSTDSTLQAEETSASSNLRVMTYNIHHGRGTDELINLPRIAEVIRRENPDLVALQEVDIKTKRSGGVDQLGELARLTGMHGRFAKGRDYDGGDYGQAMLSRWPVQSLDVHLLPGPTVEDERIAFTAEIAAAAPLPKIHFVGTHLHHRDDALRLSQATKLQQILDEQETSSTAVLLGDFNAEPNSEVMQFFLSRWQDTTDDQDLTYPSKAPIKKIDWVLVPRKGFWTVKRGTVVDETAASDHRPVVVDLKGNETPRAR